MFTMEQQRFLLQLARGAVTAAVTDGSIIKPAEVDEAYQQSLGAFVTLTKFGQLRGCIGYPEPMLPLYQAVIQGAASAALQDPRFPAVTPAELDDLHIEISVLSPLQAAQAEEVEVGTHGLVIEHGRARGLLLPQVPLEWGWNRDEFLAHTCRKAGLHADAWQRGASLFTFTAEVFSEEMLREEDIEEKDISGDDENLSSDGKDTSGKENSASLTENELTPYQIIGVNENDSFETITKSWKQLISQIHPDRYQRFGELWERKMNEELKQVNASYEWIKEHHLKKI